MLHDLVTHATTHMNDFLKMTTEMRKKISFDITFTNNWIALIISQKKINK